VASNLFFSLLLSSPDQTARFYSRKLKPPSVPFGSRRRGMRQNDDGILDEFARPGRLSFQ
jgi:hypothetical protein